METLFVPLSLFAGGLLAVQAGANAQLSKAIGSPFAATTLQLTVGTGLLLLIALFTGTLAALGALPGAEWWHLVGGTASLAARSDMKSAKTVRMARGTGSSRTVISTATPNMPSLPTNRPTRSGPQGSPCGEPSRSGRPSGSRRKP